MQPGTGQTITLPSNPFFYTLDQIALMMDWTDQKLKLRCHFVGRTSGKVIPEKMEVLNMADRGRNPDWRISEREFIRWLSFHGYTVSRSPC